MAKAGAGEGAGVRAGADIGAGAGAGAGWFRYKISKTVALSYNFRCSQDNLAISPNLIPKLLYRPLWSVLWPPPVIDIIVPAITSHLCPLHRWPLDLWKFYLGP